MFSRKIFDKKTSNICKIKYLDICSKYLDIIVDISIRRIVAIRLVVLAWF